MAPIEIGGRDAHLSQEDPDDLRGQREMSRVTLLGGALALLGGCAGSAGPCNPTAVPAFPPPADECGAAELSRYVGAQPGTEVRAEIATRLGDRRVRYIAPGDAVTMDYSPSRLNVELGTDGRIVRLRCG